MRTRFTAITFPLAALCTITAAIGLTGDVRADSKQSAPLVAPRPFVPLDQIDGPLPDDFIIAEIGATQIRFDEFARDQGNLIEFRELRTFRGQKTVQPARLRVFQEQYLRQRLPRYIETLLLSRQFEAGLDDEKRETLNSALDQIWDDQLQSMMQKYDVETTEELEDAVLAKEHSPLNVLRVQFERQLFAREYVLSRISHLESPDERKLVAQNVIDDLVRNSPVRTVIDVATTE